MPDCVRVPDVLLPREGIDRTKWAVVACDQFTSQPEYWEELDAFVGTAPSTLRMILPELYLSGDLEEKAEEICGFRQYVRVLGREKLHLRLHQRQRCAQLMGGIPGELALRSKTVIQTVQHSVEGAAEFLKLRQHIFGELHI